MRSGALGWLLVLQLGQPLRPAGAADGGSIAGIEEQFSRGEQAWKASCPKPTEDGSCTEVRQLARPRLVVVDRDPALVAEARRRFLTVAKLWRRMGGGEMTSAGESLHPRRLPSRHADYGELFRADPAMDSRGSTDAAASAPPRPALVGAAHAAAGAAFYLAEAQWEELIRIEPPRDLVLPKYGPEVDLLVIGEAVPKWSPQLQRRLLAFISRKLDQLSRTRRMYLTLFAMREAPFDVAAAARIGQLYEDFPADLLDDKAVTAFERCFDMGAKNARYDEWFRLCEQELTALRPFEFPKANEFVPEPTHDEGAIAPIPPLTRLE